MPCRVNIKPRMADENREHTNYDGDDVQRKYQRRFRKYSLIVFIIIITMVVSFLEFA